MVDLSSLEAACLASVAEHEVPVHAAVLVSSLRDRLGLLINRGALARTLATLERSGHLSGRRIGPSAHGGPARIGYAITDAGRYALAARRRNDQRSTRAMAFSPLALAFVRDPPEGSKTAAARDYGIDLTWLARAAKLSNEERYRQAVDALRIAAGYARS